MSDRIGPLNIVDGPSQVQIDEWKVRHGELFVAKFSDEEKYIYRPLKRFEYKQIVGVGQTDSKAFAEEKVVQMCVVWPVMDPTKISMFKAGTISTLVDLIMASSNFGIVEDPVKL